MAGAERGEASCRTLGPTPRGAGGPHPTGSPSAWPGSANPAEAGGWETQKRLSPGGECGGLKHGLDQKNPSSTPEFTWKGEL